MAAEQDIVIRNIQLLVHATLSDPKHVHSLHSASWLASVIFR